MGKVLVETSARHVHVTEKDLETLFGKGYQLTKKKDLSQPGQYACAERVDVVGEKKTLSVEEKMEEIRIVNRAKWLLISELKMDEPQAHRYIEKQAMDRCISRKEIAEEIIRTYS